MPTTEEALSGAPSRALGNGRLHNLAYNRRFKRRRFKRVAKVRVGRAGIICAQMALVIGVYGLGCLLASFLPIDLPGNIVGMGLLLVLLATGALKKEHVGRACQYLIDNMSVFFIPAGVGIMGCAGLLSGANGLKFAFVCVVTTIIVFLATSWTVIATQRLMQRSAKRRATTACQPATDNGEER